MSEIIESFMISDNAESGMIVRGIDMPDYNISSNDLYIIISTRFNEYRVVKIDSLNNDFNFLNLYKLYLYIPTKCFDFYSFDMWKESTGRQIDIELIRKYLAEYYSIYTLCIHKDVAPVTAAENENVSVIKDISPVYVISKEERDALCQEIIDVLIKYGYNPYVCAVYNIIDEWVANKGYLINMFKEHPNYNGKYQIAFNRDFTRKVDKNVLIDFTAWLNSSFVRNNYGGISLYCNVVRIINSYLRGDDINQTVSETFAAEINHILPEAKIVAGMKTSRALNKLFGIIGIDKVSGYNREFAKCSDALNPLTIKRHTVLSVHPVDYLLMSNGNSWKSCHMIGTNYDGCYSGGTLSYMLDTVSMVFYTVDASASEENLELEKKINRNMFFYDNKRLVQSRLYPQGCDYGFREVYDDYRHIVQRIVTTCLDIPNFWKLRRGIKPCTQAIVSGGVAYADWHHFSTVNISTLKEFANETFEKMVVGAPPICPECGVTHDHQESILCDSCYDEYDEDYTTCPICGEEFYRDNGCYSNETGLYYCEDCVHWCAYHQTYEPNDAHDFYYDDAGNCYCEKAIKESDYLFFCSECESVINLRRTDAFEIDEHIFCNEGCAESFGYVQIMKDGTHQYVNSNKVNIYTCSFCGEEFLEDDFNTDTDTCLECLEAIKDNELAEAS